MIISRGRAYIFVHIPKTGGTSLALALEARAMKDDIMLGDTPKARKRRRRLVDVETRGRLWKHSTLADAEGLITSQDMDQCFVFTMVRNPWDRMVSYYHWLRMQSFDHPAVRLAKEVSFAGFLSDPLTQAAQRAAPAAHYVRDAEGRDRSDLMIRLEHFEQDARPLMEHLGFELQLPHANPSDGRGHYRSHYDATTRDIVAEICAEDIGRFGYAF